MRCNSLSTPGSRRAPRLAWLTAAAVLEMALAGSAYAQLPQARLYAIFPPGAQAGQNAEVTVLAGDDLDEAGRIIFDHPGITATPRPDVASAVGNSFQVTVAPDVPPGLYEIRCSGRFGVSNPRYFQVTQRPTALESEGNGNFAEADDLGLDTLLFGRMNNGADVDWFRVSLKAGQRVVFYCSTDNLDSQMSGLLSLYDASGERRLDSVRSLPGRNPVLVFNPTADGNYLLKLHDTTYRGGNEFGYGLLASTSPHVKYALPAAAIAGTQTHVTLFGYNLPGGSPVEVGGTSTLLQRMEVDISAPADPLLDVEAKLTPAESSIDAFTYRLQSERGPSNPVRLGITNTQVLTEQEPNDDAPQTVTLPVDVTGQFSKIADTDRFRFSAKKGDSLWIEVFGQRMGGHVDPLLIIEQVKSETDGKETVSRLAAQDDDKSNLLQNVFETETMDPVHRLQVPADGLYQVTLRDRYWETRGDDALIYRCRIRFEQPDFRLVAVPAAPTAGQTWPVGLRRGDTFAVHVLAFREDGYEGPIDVSVEGLPEGVTSSGALIAEKQNSSMLMFTVGPEGPAGWHPVKVIGTAHIENAAAVAAVEQARQQVAEAEKSIPELQKAADEHAGKLATMEKALADAAAAAQAAAIDDPLKKQLEEASRAVLTKLKEGHQAATEMLASAQKSLEESKANLASAEQNRLKAARTLRHEARVGTVLWSSNNNNPATSRVTGRLGLSIISEPAPFHLTTNLNRVEVRPGQQLLMTAHLDRRNGFDDVVKYDIQGLDKKANIEIEKTDFAKDQSEKILRITIKENAAVGIHTAWLAAQADVNYRRNPERAERLKQAFEEAKKVAEAARQTAEQMAKAKAEAETALKSAQQQVQETAKFKQQKESEVEADRKKLEAASANVKRLQDSLTGTGAIIDAVGKLAAQLNKSVAEVEPAVTAAQTALQATTAMLQGDPENATLKQQVEAAQNAVAAATKLVEDSKQQQVQAEAALAAVQKRAAELREQQKAATVQLADLDQALKARLAELDSATAAAARAAEAEASANEKLVAAAKAEKEATEAAKAAEAARQAAEKAANDAAKDAEPKKIKFTPPSDPVIFIVKPAPLKLAAEVPNNGQLKRGQKVDVKVKVARTNGFAGPVQIELPQVPGVSGLSAAPIVIPPDANEGNLTIAAAADAPTAEINNLFIRSRSEFDGQAFVDASIKLKITE